MNDSAPDELSAKLRAWKVEPTVTAGFSRGVWQRIAAREEGFRQGVAEWVSALNPHQPDLHAAGESGAE